jgi:hypothetical protein
MRWLRLSLPFSPRDIKRQSRNVDFCDFFSLSFVIQCAGRFNFRSSGGGQKVIKKGFADMTNDFFSPLHGGKGKFLITDSDVVGRLGEHLCVICDFSFFLLLLLAECAMYN